MPQINQDLNIPPPGRGIYLHIPFCRTICHYCDFAKTANFDRSHILAYMAMIKAHLEGWFMTPMGRDLIKGGITSVFLGGGTPSLLAEEYEEVFELLAQYLGPLPLSAVEVTLETNPDDVTYDRLKIWRNLGINRLSIGLQTFNDRGLKFLKRTHQPDRAIQAIRMAKEYFDNINIDLIYGWPGQSQNEWRYDLEMIQKLEIPHASLYTLTYENRTPIGRAMHRGKILPVNDDELHSNYQCASEVLADFGMVHEEVSNWSLPGFSCKHNWIYWTDQSYLGLGAGAAGYFADHGPFGLRYCYPKSIRYKNLENYVTVTESLSESFGLEVEDHRTAEQWALESLGASLRCAHGFNLANVERRLGRKMTLTPVLQEGLNLGLLEINERVILRPDQWYVEMSWAQEVIKGLDL